MTVRKKQPLNFPNRRQAGMEEDSAMLRSPLSSFDAKEPIPLSPKKKNSTPTRSPLSSDDAEDPIPPSPKKKNPPPPPPRSPLSSSDAEDPIPPSPNKIPPPPPPRSPFPDAEDPASPMSPQAGGREGAVASPLPSPAREAENPNPIPIPQRKLPLIYQLARDGSLGSPLRSPLRETTTAARRDGSAGSPLRPTPREELFPLALPAPPAQEVSEKPAFLAAETVPVAAAHRLLKDELTLGVVTKAEGYASGPRVVPAPGMVRRRAVRRAALGLRISALLLCLVAFSVMTADKTAGWAGDSFDRYDEYRYLVSVNVIAFVYSGFQVCAQIHYMIKKKHIIRGPMQYYFAFSMDQVLAYLLMSASSSAATRNDSWVSMFGSDDFTDMANASIAMSFLAFVALALSSVISVYSLFRWRA